MADHQPGGREDRDAAFARRMGEKAARHERARRRRPSVLSWLGAFGMVGWTIALPALIGALIGRWLGAVAGDTVSWTLTLLLVGVVLGAGVAWSWLRQQGDRAD